MTAFRKVFPLLATLALTACAGVAPASRNAMPAEFDPGQIGVNQAARASASPTALPTAAARMRVMAPKYTVKEIRVNVPRSLKVSEANSFMPQADIVWRGEPLGDRYAQVARIFNDGVMAGTRGMVSGPAAVVEVEVTRFHCLTEKTRFTVGGNHAIHFTLTVRDAASGAVLDGPRSIVADVKASGGAAAIAEDQAGRTQRVVVVERLAQVIRRELSGPVTGAPANAALEARFRTDTLITPTGL